MKLYATIPYFSTIQAEAAGRFWGWVRVGSELRIGEAGADLSSGFGQVCGVGLGLLVSDGSIYQVEGLGSVGVEAVRSGFGHRFAGSPVASGLPSNWVGSVGLQLGAWGLGLGCHYLIGSGRA